MERGKLIVIEGTDGSGKATQADILLLRMNAENMPAKKMSFPRYDLPSGRIVGQSYLGKDVDFYGWGGDSGWFGDPDKVDFRVASMFYAADRVFATPEILDIVESGQHLILDRYYQSNMAHQGGKVLSPLAREEVFDYIESLELKLNQIPREDTTIFLYIPLDVALEMRMRRMEESGEKQDGHESNLEHLKRAEETYLQLFQRYKDSWTKIDCSPDGTYEGLKSRKEIGEEIFSEVMEKL